MGEQLSSKQPAVYSDQMLWAHTLCSFYATGEMAEASTIGDASSNPPGAESSGWQWGRSLSTKLMSFGSSR